MKEYLNEDKGIIVEIKQINNIEFPYLVTKVKNQKMEYQGVFKTEENAENKATELAN